MFIWVTSRTKIPLHIVLFTITAALIWFFLLSDKYSTLTFSRPSSTHNETLKQNQTSLPTKQDPAPPPPITRPQLTITPMPVKSGEHRLAVIVPVRDREEHLLVFSYIFVSLMKRQNIKGRIFVIEQVDRRSFNRAKLFNIGWHLTQQEYDYHCFHDVDTVPADSTIDYSYPSKPRHLAVNVEKHGWGLPYPSFVGGVICLNREDFIKVNGFSNNFWGWGGEDDDFGNRIRLAGLSLERPNRAYYDSLDNGKHGSRDLRYYSHNLIELHNSQQRWKQTGLNDLWYKIVSGPIQESLFTRWKVELLPESDPNFMKGKRATL
jgi:hypothetical protein